MSIDLDAWWRAVRPHLEPIPTPTLTVDALEQELRERLASWAPAIAERFELPPMFRRYLELLELRSWRGDDMDHELLLHGTHAVLAELDHALEVRGNGGGFARNAGWLEIGRAREHARFFVCCDHARRQFGGFHADDDDGHPWLEDADVEPAPFESFLFSIARRAAAVSPSSRDDVGPDPARVLVDRLRTPGAGIPEGEADPFVDAWRRSRDVRAMIELLEIGASRGIYELFARETRSEREGPVEWFFCLRLPDRGLVRVAIRDDCKLDPFPAETLRWIVPAIAPRTEWARATRAQHDGIRDPIAQLIYALDALGGPTPPWVERWVGRAGSLWAPWQEARSDACMLALLERSGRADLVERARAAKAEVPPALPHIGCDRFPVSDDGTPFEERLVEQARVWADAIRAAVPIPPTLDELLLPQRPQAR